MTKKCKDGDSMYFVTKSWNWYVTLVDPLEFFYNYDPRVGSRILN